MKVTIEGVREPIKNEILNFFKGLQDRGYVYNIAWAETDGVLYNIYFDMGDMVVCSVLDGLEFYRKTAKYDNYYIDADEFVEFKIN